MRTRKHPRLVVSFILLQDVLREVLMIVIINLIILTAIGVGVIE